MGSVTCVLCMTAAHCDCDWTSRKPSENRLQKRFICAVAQRNCLAQHMSKLVQTAAEATSIRHELAGQPVQHTVRKAGSVAMSMMLANSDRVAGCKTGRRTTVRLGNDPTVPQYRCGGPRGG